MPIHNNGDHLHVMTMVFFLNIIDNRNVQFDEFTFRAQGFFSVFQMALTKIMWVGRSGENKK